MKVASTKIVKNEFNEYQVKAYDQNGQRIHNADYFTDDKQDAIETAKRMTQWQDQSQISN